jgi:nitrate reductase NapD
MKIASLVLKVAPEQIAALSADVLKIPGAEVHGASQEQGRLIVTVEDGPGHSMTDSLLAVSQLPQILALTLAYEYTDEGLELPEFQEA